MLYFHLTFESKSDIRRPTSQAGRRHTDGHRMHVVTMVIASSTSSSTAIPFCVCSICIQHAARRLLVVDATDAERALVTVRRAKLENVGGVDEEPDVVEGEGHAGVEHAEEVSDEDGTVTQVRE